MKLTLITGGAGFVATNTADRLLSTGRRVRIIDDLSRPGVENNLRWLVRRHGDLLEVDVDDIRDQKKVHAALIDADQVFHFAAQVAVTTSLEDPMRDAAVNIQGTLNLLEEARMRAEPPSIVFTSTNKVYGLLAGVQVREHDGRYEPDTPSLRAGGIAEDQPLQFATPYGCSKGAADQYILDWSRCYGIPAVVLRMSCIYGPHQFGTEDQGWVAHFLLRALHDAPITVYGDGKQVRDILFVDDLVEAMLLAQSSARKLSGTAFNIGGGPSNAVSLLDVIEMIAGLIGRRPQVRRRPWRQGDQRYYVTNHERFSAATGWRPAVGAREGVALLHEWLLAANDDRTVAA